MGHRQSDMTEKVCFTCDLRINNGAASSLSFSKAQNSLEASSAFTRPPESFPAQSCPAQLSQQLTALLRFMHICILPLQSAWEPQAGRSPASYLPPTPLRAPS